MSLGSRAAGVVAATEAYASSLRGFISTASEAANDIGNAPSKQTSSGHGAIVAQVKQGSANFANPLRSKSLLADKKAAIKDNICTNTLPQLPTTCDSKILGPGFLSPYNATVVDLLGQAGCTIVGKTSMDEFGMGSHSIHTTFGDVYQEDQEGNKLSAGGSSGGSALAVQADSCDFALGTDTGGSVRLPAAYAGLVGFKPSYGLLSRWGVVAYANSLDTVGILAKNTATVQDVFNVLNRYDKKDPTSISPGTRSRLESLSTPRGRSLQIGIPLDYNISEVHPTVRSAWHQTLLRITSLGHTVHPISLPRTKQALSTYYVLAPSEASSNLAKYDGIRYGHRASGPDNAGSGYLYSKTRGEGFGAEVKRRILLGAYSLSAKAMDNYFIQAQRVRRLVQRDFDDVFNAPNFLHDDNDNTAPSTTNTQTQEEVKVDFILSPTAPTPPPLLSDLRTKPQNSLDAYTNDIFTVPASLAGLPAISIPYIPETKGQGDNGANIGMQIIGQYGSDRSVLEFAMELENAVHR